MNEELKVVISAEISDLKAGVQEAQGEIDKLTTGNGGKFDQFNTGFQKVGDVAKGALKTVAVGAAGVATAFLSLGPATEEYRVGMAKLETAFTTTGSSADTAKSVFNDLYRVLGEDDVAVEAAGHLAQLTNDQQALSEWTNVCQGVYATFGDSLPIESLTEAANETAKTGSLTGALADALNWAGVSEEDFQAKLDATTSASEREALIRETLTGLYDDAAATYEETAAGTLAANEAQAALNESMAGLGEVAEPINTALKDLAATVLSELTPYIQDFAENHLPNVISALEGVGSKIGEVFSWIADHWELLSTIATILGIVAVAISVVSTALGVYAAAMIFASTVSLPVIGIIAAVVAGIAALVAIIVICIKNWDDISAAAKKCWDAIKNAVSTAVDAIVGFFQNLFAKAKEIWDNIKTAASEKWGAIKDAMSEKVEDAKEAISEKYEAMKENITNVLDAAKSTVQEKLNNMKDAYNEHGGGIKGIAAAAIEGVKGYYTAGYTFIDNLTNGKLTEIANEMKAKLAVAKQYVSEKWSEIKSNTSAKLSEIKSNVSAKWEEIKSNISTKVNAAKTAATNAFNTIKTNISTALGNALTTVTTKFDAIKTKIQTTIETARDKVKDAIEKIKSFFNFEWSLPKLKLPHFTISGSFSLNPPSVPTFGIEWYKLGGVFDDPTLFPFGGSIGGLGEDGAEAIVPLEKNTEWMNVLANKLSERMSGGNTPIILQVDGKTFAQTSINTMNQLTRQTGKLGLNIV